MVKKVKKDKELKSKKTVEAKPVEKLEEEIA